MVQACKACHQYLLNQWQSFNVSTVGKCTRTVPGLMNFEDFPETVKPIRFCSFAYDYECCVLALLVV